MDTDKNYNMQHKPIADKVVKTIGDVGASIADADPTSSDPRQALIVGFLAGFETALHVALCEERGGERMVRTLAMSMDMSVHEGETDFHDIAENLLVDIYMAMLVGLAEADGGTVIEVTADDPYQALEQVRMKLAEFIAEQAPTKPVSDA